MSDFIYTQAGKAPVNNIEIYYETFGNPTNPAVLLVMGLDSQCVMYGEDFINPFLDAGFYVIRFDNRDIGLSTWLNDSWHKRRPYTLEDMAKDSVELLDYLKIKQAHLIGTSMGGMISQRIAISYSHKVLSLTSIMSTGYSLDANAVKTFREKIFVKTLPYFLKRIYVKNKYFDRKVTVDSYVAGFRMLKGTRFPYNEAHFRKVFTESIEVRKGQNPRARYQQFCAVAASGSRLKELHKIKVPTLIIHGTADPLVPVKHAEIYAPLIPQAKLVLIEGMGHELPKAAMPEFMPEIINHLKQKSTIDISI